MIAKNKNNMKILEQRKMMKKCNEVQACQLQ